MRRRFTRGRVSKPRGSTKRRKSSFTSYQPMRQRLGRRF